MDLSMEGIKTAAGKNRAVPIPGIIEKYINDRVQTSKEYLIERDGAQVTYDHFVRFMYYPALKAAGVKKRTPHKARHTFATLMAESGVDTLSIKAIMGHTDYAFTATKYTHIGTDHLRTEITKVKI
jgi:site-specific recombinase XerD